MCRTLHLALLNFKSSSWAHFFSKVKVSPLQVLQGQGLPMVPFSTLSHSSVRSPWPRAGRCWGGCGAPGASPHWSQGGGWGVTPALSLQGKQKYTLPLYRAMWGGSESARALAMETFSATAPQLHVNVQNYIKKILGLEVAED